MLAGKAIIKEKEEEAPPGRKSQTVMSKEHAE
jgi:hypothetical protein